MKKMLKENKAQVATEYLLILGAVVVVALGTALAMKQILRPQLDDVTDRIDEGLEG